MVRSTSRLRKLSSSAIETPRKTALPRRPARFWPLRLILVTTSPPSPQSATLAKSRWLPSAKTILPTSMFRVVPPARRRAAAWGSVGRLRVRRMSLPVPLGISPTVRPSTSGAPLSSKQPLITSLRVPSPPTATTRRTDARPVISRRVTRVASPRLVVRWARMSMSASRSADRIWGQRRMVWPPALTGLTTTRVEVSWFTGSGRGLGPCPGTRRSWTWGCGCRTGSRPR